MREGGGGGGGGEKDYFIHKQPISRYYFKDLTFGLLATIRHTKRCKNGYKEGNLIGTSYDYWILFVLMTNKLFTFKQPIF